MGGILRRVRVDSRNDQKSRGKGVCFLQGANANCFFVVFDVVEVGASMCVDRERPIGTGHYKIDTELRNLMALSTC